MGLLVKLKSCLDFSITIGLGDVVAILAKGWQVLQAVTVVITTGTPSSSHPQRQSQFRNRGNAPRLGNLECPLGLVSIHRDSTQLRIAAMAKEGGSTVLQTQVAEFRGETLAPAVCVNRGASLTLGRALYRELIVHQ